MILEDLEKLIKETAERESLYTLVNFDEVKFDNKNALDFVSTITKTRNHIKESGIDFDQLTNDLINSISSDVRYSLTNAYIYFPHTNNFVKEVMPFGSTGVKAPTYFKTMGDKRFFYYVNTSFEKLYIFWDRIGDILALAFNLNIPERSVYFSTVVRNLDDQLDKSKHGVWLRNFYDEEYEKILNRLRVKIVHYRQKDSYFFTEWLKLAGNYSENSERLAELQREKEELLPMLKRQVELANEGFEHMIRFIAEQGTYETKQ
ncbi:MAG: Cthe_2314 family HEPN domain-containing protein [Candidatus Paceibacterota bacterium]